jgi:hypothetical protein
MTLGDLASGRSGGGMERFGDKNDIFKARAKPSGGLNLGLAGGNEGSGAGSLGGNWMDSMLDDMKKIPCAEPKPQPQTSMSNYFPNQTSGHQTTLSIPEPKLQSGQELFGPPRGSNNEFQTMFQNQ